MTAARCRVFLDANVLFSAAWRDDAGVLRLWRRADARLVTSPYAVDEAFRNLETTARRERLFRLTASMETPPDPRPTYLTFGRTVHTLRTYIARCS